VIGSVRRCLSGRWPFGLIGFQGRRLHVFPLWHRIPSTEKTNSSTSPCFNDAKITPAIERSGAALPATRAVHLCQIPFRPPVSGGSSTGHRNFCSMNWNRRDKSSGVDFVGYSRCRRVGQMWSSLLIASTFRTTQGIGLSVGPGLRFSDIVNPAASVHRPTSRPCRTSSDPTPR
jgi:hypothetical protein